MTARNPVGGKTMYEPLNVGQATAKNQFSNSSGVGYDADGNMTKNGGEQYTYDAEDRLVTSDGYTYSYDGDGERVLKWNGSNGILYSNGLSGTAVEEDTPNDGWVYLFFNGQRVARDNGTPYYYMSDHLGSLGVVTDESGDIVQESDYYPYGGEIVITAGNGSGADNYKFTGKERDNESGLDNFGARYDSSALGRFMTPDWAARATGVPYAAFGDPQSLNLYGYVRNDPVSNIDPDGHGACTPFSTVGNPAFQGDCKPGKQYAQAKPGTATPTTKDQGCKANFCVTVTDHKSFWHSIGAWYGGVTIGIARWGRLGGPAHRAAVSRIADDLDKMGYNVETEKFVRTPNGAKNYRFVDVYGEKSTGEIKMVQVGRTNAKGAPVTREENALNDIQEATGVRPQFVDYNSPLVTGEITPIDHVTGIAGPDNSAGGSSTDMVEPEDIDIP